MWGHDFRPDYLFIRRALEALGDPAVLGMTATATPAAAREIATALGRDLAVVRTSVVRPNLRYDVEEVGGNEDRLRILVERLGAVEDGSAIVYARSRDSCERVARTLRGHGLAHGALPRRPRGRRALARAGGLRQRPHPGRRRDHGVRHGNRQARRSARLPLQLPGLARELRADGRARRPGRSPERDAAAREPLRCHRRAAVRRRGHSRARRPAPRLPGDPGARRHRRSGARSRPATTTRACSSGCSSRPASCAAATTPDARCGSSSSPSIPGPERSWTTCSSATRPRRGPAWSGSCGSRRATAAATPRSPSTSARRSTAPCGACDVCDPPRGRSAHAVPRRRFPPTWPARSSAPSSASRGRSGAARSSRCCADPSLPHPRPAPRSPSGSSRRPPMPR